MMKQMQKLQTEMMEAQDRLKDEQIEGSAGGRAVVVTASGDLEIKSVVINPSVVDPDDIEMLQDLVQAATNDALRGAQELAATKMGGLAGGLGGSLGLPGL